MSVPDLLFFTEASAVIGHGHVSRCHALSLEAQAAGLFTAFVSEDDYTTDYLSAIGEKVISNPAEEGIPRFVVRDFMGGSSVDEVIDWQKRGVVTLLLDDCGPSRSEAALVVDPYMTPLRSRGLCHSDKTRYLYGFDYTPLHRQFQQYAATAAPGVQFPPRL